jgi:hypothetical protein
VFRHVLAFLLCTPAIISSVLDECIVLYAYLMVSGILFIAFLFSEFIYSGDILIHDALIVVINPLYCKS